MTTAALADWTTPQPFALPDLGPGVEGPLRDQLETALRQLAADPSVQALVLFGSRATGTARDDSDLDLLVALLPAAAIPASAGGSGGEWQRRCRAPGRLPLACDQRSGPPWAGVGGAAMTPQEDARVLLALVDRHLRALRFNLDPAYPDEEWGLTALQAVEKLLKVLIVLRDERPPFTHLLNVLAQLAGVELDPRLMALQPYAVEARYEEGPFPLAASREAILAAMEQLRHEAVLLLGEG